MEPGECKETVACLFQAVGERPTLQAPFAQEGLAAGFDRGGGVGVDHVAVILGQVVMHM